MLLRVFVLSEELRARALWGFLEANWRELAHSGRPLSVEVKEFKAKRSLEQNKFYWRLLNEISEKAWVGGRQFSTNSWHELFKRTFIGMEELPRGGTVGISTTTLSVAEFSDYLNQVEAYAATDLGITIS